MRINHILFFLGTIFLTACTGEHIPDDVIPRDKMVNLLAAVHIADGDLTNYSQMPDTLYKHGMARYLKLFKDYQTDTAQFKKSLIFYSKKAEMFDVMYDDVIKKINGKIDSLNKIRVTIAKADSVKNVIRTKQLQDSIKKATELKNKAAQKGGVK